MGPKNHRMISFLAQQLTRNDDSKTIVARSSKSEKGRVREMAQEYH